MGTTSDSNKEAQHNQIEIWRAEAVKNWASALKDLENAAEGIPMEDAILAIRAKIRSLLGIVDDLG